MSFLKTSHLDAVRNPQPRTPQPDLPPNVVHPHLLYDAKRAFKSVAMTAEDQKVINPVLLNKSGLITIDEYETLWVAAMCYGIFLAAPPKRTWVKPSIKKLNRIPTNKKVGTKQAMSDLFG